MDNNLKMDSLSDNGDAQYRAVFDADVTFSNVGGLQAQRFRVDVPSSSVTDAEIGLLFVRSLDLLMTESVAVRNVEIIQEPHKGTRGGPSAPKISPLAS